MTATMASLIEPREFAGRAQGEQMTPVRRRLLAGAIALAFGTVLSAHADEPKAAESKAASDAVTDGTVTAVGCPSSIAPWPAR